jgi:hypothetical protein
MNRQSLLIIAIIFSLIGLIALFFISSWLNAHPEHASFLQISGVVNSVRIKNGVTIMSIDPAELSVVAFEPLELEKGEHVTFYGRLQEYKGRVEFVVEDVT